MPADLKTLRHAKQLSDAAAWNEAHDEGIDKNLALGAYNPVSTESIDKEMLVSPRWQYKYKTRAYGTLDKRSAICTVQGDPMKPGVHYDSDKTAARTPS